jgi:hypothetical protein
MARRQVLPTMQLTQEEKDHLLHIFNTRRNYFVIAFIALFILPFFRTPLFGMVVDSEHVYKVKDYDGLTNRQEMYIVFLALELPIVATGCIVYFRSIRPFSLDVRQGVKEVVPYQVINKQYFGYTGQYFISFSDPTYMHHEVDHEFYNRCQIGDTAFIFRAPRSGYVFTANGRFTML